MQPTLVILAAGAGSRYGGLKQLVPIGPNGETLLEYSAYDALRAGFERVVLVVRPETEGLFRERLDAGMSGRVPVAYVHQTLSDLPDGVAAVEGRARPWGTGQAVLAAGGEVEGPFAVINADDFYGAESFAVLARFWGDESPERPDLAVVGFHVSETLTDSGPVSRALCETDDRGHLREIVEIPKVWRQNEGIVYEEADGSLRTLQGDELVSMNMWGFAPELFSELRRGFTEFLAHSSAVPDAEFLLPDVIRAALREQRFEVEVLLGAGEWCGLPFREDRERATTIIARLVAEGRYPEELWG
jgi:UTP-glucose-1-phosphate uridylyltransferase